MSLATGAAATTAQFATGAAAAAAAATEFSHRARSQASMVTSSPQVVKDVVIVGGGLGGMAAAIHLRKRGFDAQVYEKNSTISGGEGTLISLFPNGCRALNDADPSIVHKMRAEGAANIYSAVVTKSGEAIGEWSLSSQMESIYGQPMISILWKHALRILSECLPETCKHTGYDCQDVIQEEDGAVVHFKKGEEDVRVKASLVIGADGIRSRVRTSLFGWLPPQDEGRTMWRAVIDTESCSHKALLQDGNISTASEGRTVFIINRVHGKLYWAFSVADDATDGQTKVRSKDAQEAKQRLLQFYAGWELATHIIEATDAELILERRVSYFPVPPKWSKGRTVLLGDAVHAVTPALGQGANMAFEDARELASQLSASQDLSSAIENYEAVRLPRAQKISQASLDTSRMRPKEFYDWIYSN